MLKTWNRHCFTSFTKIVFLFLFCFYFLYILLDYSSRISSHSSFRFEWWVLLRYYGVVFIRRLEVLLPFSLLLGTTVTLHGIWRVNGWIALLANGISLRKVFRPFFILAILGALLLYANEEWLLPKALKELNTIESYYFHKGEGLGEINRRTSVKLKDGSRLFFESLDAKEKELSDVWFIPTWNEVWHIERLKITENSPYPVGFFVDQFRRDGEGRLVAFEDYKERSFDKISFHWNDLMEMVSQPQNYAIDQLIYKLFKQKGLGVFERQEMLSALLKKVLFPLLGFLCVLGPLPYFFSLYRAKSFFLSYLGVIFAFISFYLLMSALSVVGSSGVLSPWVALGVPFCGVMGFVIWRNRLLFAYN